MTRPLDPGDKTAEIRVFLTEQERIRLKVQAAKEKLPMGELARRKIVGYMGQSPADMPGGRRAK
jgi:hypothetical protein